MTEIDSSVHGLPAILRNNSTAARLGNEPKLTSFSANPSEISSWALDFSSCAKLDALTWDWLLLGKKNP